MNNKINLIALLLLLIVLPHTVLAQQNKLQIVYSGNIDGELEPCGCSAEGDLGGVLRHSTTLKELRQQHPDLIALSTGGLIVSMAPQDKLTGEYILKGFTRLDYDAMALQWNDLAYGTGFVSDQELPWVSSNWPDDTFMPSQVISRGENKLYFFSWLDPAASPEAAMNVEHAQGSEDLDVLAKALSDAQRQGLTLLATTLTLEQAKTLPLEHVDILFIRAAYELFGEPQQLGNTLVLQVGSRGMRLGQLELDLSKDGRIASFEHTVISMPTSIEDDPALQGWYEEYNATVKADYLKRVELRKALESGESPFAGEEVCQSCHQEEHTIWRDTLHSNAFAKLEQVNKAFDPACIKCHTVGFETEGGFIDFDATPHLLNVQCESCHGAAKQHAESGGMKAPENQGWQPKQMCAQCHVQKHSPSFDFGSYWLRIKHNVVK